MRGCVGLSAHSAFHWWSAHCAARMLLLSDELMRCCAASTSGCLDLRRHALALDARVSAEWSRCPGSVARRVRGSVAPLRRSSADWMPARIGRLSAGVGRRHPVTIRKASLMAESMRWVWALRHQTGAQYSADQGWGGYSQSCCSSTPAGACKLLQERDAWCQLLAKWLKMSTIRERPVQRYSEIFELGAERHGFVVVFDFHLTFSFLVKMEGCQHRFCDAELYLPSLEVFTYSCHVLGQHPFHCVPVSISMHDC